MTSNAFQPTAIDLSRVSPPEILENLDFEEMYSGFMERFIAFWDAARIKDPDLPEYTVSSLETDPAAIVGQSYSYLRLLDRQRVNDAIKALLAPYSSGTNLDNLVARQGIERLAVIEATDVEPAVMESDARLLERYLLSFGAASAGSADCYKFHALTAWPGAGDINVVGRAIHGRRGDVDIVVMGSDGDAPTDENLALVRAAVLATNVHPETTSVSILAANRLVYDVNLTITVPSGPDLNLVKDDATDRVNEKSTKRTYINGEIPVGLLSGAAYGDSVLSVTDNSPVVIEPDPYSVPVMSGIVLTAQVRS